jgi:TetR/AcrR family tetracycline transcriptional repressor
VKATERDSQRGSLSRELILHTALAVVESQGVSALSMRGLARELGVVPTAIYWHVHNRDELLQGVLDLAMAGVEIALPRRGQWQHKLRTFCHTLRDEMVAHPYVFTLAEQLPTRSIGPVTNTFLEIVMEAGYDSKDAAEIVIMLLDYSVGSAYMKVHGEPTEEFTQRWATAPTTNPADIPAVVEFRRHANHDRGFTRGLDILIAGLGPPTAQK